MHTLAQQRQNTRHHLAPPSRVITGFYSSPSSPCSLNRLRVPTAARRILKGGEAQGARTHYLLRGDRVGGAHTLLSRRERAAGSLVRRCQRRARRKRGPILRPRVGLRPCQMCAREREGWWRHPCTHSRTRFVSSPARVRHKRRRPLSALLSKTVNPLSLTVCCCPVPLDRRSMQTLWLFRKRCHHHASGYRGHRDWG